MERQNEREIIKKTKHLVSEGKPCTTFAPAFLQCSLWGGNTILFSSSYLPLHSISEFLKTWGFLANLKNIYPFVFSIKWLFTIPAVSFFSWREKRGECWTEDKTGLPTAFANNGSVFFRTVVMEECCSADSRERYIWSVFCCPFLLLF